MHPPSAADGDEYDPIEYKTPVTNSTFTFNTGAKTQADAEMSCQEQGGHLAVYSSEAEQADVEAYYEAQQWLLPKFYKYWWHGLNKNSSVYWTWTDGAAKGGHAAVLSGPRMRASPATL